MIHGVELKFGNDAQKSTEPRVEPEHQKAIEEAVKNRLRIIRERALKNANVSK